MRNGGPVEPGVIDALQEVIADAAATGASLHVVHITSMGLRETPLCLAMIDGRARRGLDVTTEAYPYTAGMTDIGSAIFSRGLAAAAGRHLASATCNGPPPASASPPNRSRAIASRAAWWRSIPFPRTSCALAMANPLVMIASDGILENGKGHPRAAGTYCRVLGRYVRERARAHPDGRHPQDDG